MKYLTLTIFLFSSLLTGQLKAQNQAKKTRILFIYDASNSMNGRWQSKAKHEVAKKLLISTLDSLESIPNLELALRTYGDQYHFPPQKCDDTHLLVPFKKGNHNQIKSKLETLNPKGTTPIALTLEASANDFPPCGNCTNIIILITDGIEECNGDPCAVSYFLQKQGIILKPFIIGIGIDLEFKKSFSCIGNYYDANSEESFRTILGMVISQALNNTSTQINLLDINNKANETNVGFTLHNHFSKKVVYNMIHTMNDAGTPDTLSLDPAITYDLKVHTVPPVTKDSINLTPGIHNIIAVKTPQGDLIVNDPGTRNAGQIKVIVKESDKNQTLNVQNIGETRRYLVGTYDLEILTLPRINISGIRVSQSHTTKIDIPQPGLGHFDFGVSGYACIYQKNKNIMEKIYDFNGGTIKTSLYLQPGDYWIVFRSNSAKELIFSKEKAFTINPGVSTTVNFE